MPWKINGTGEIFVFKPVQTILQVAFHAVRNLIRIARGKAVMHWAQTGFQRTKQAASNKETPRNLFGFKDGTVNPKGKKKAR